MGRRGRFASLLLLVGLACGPTPGLAQEGVVLAVRPDGVVVDVGDLEDVRNGSRLVFLRATVERRETAQGRVLAIRDGKALVRLERDGEVSPDDVAIVCSEPGEPDPYGAVRAIVDELRTRPAQPGSPAARRVRSLVLQLQSSLDARDGVVRSGACDTTEHDRRISALAGELEVLVTDQQPAGRNPADADQAPRRQPGARESDEPTPPAAPWGSAKEVSGNSAAPWAGAASDSTQEDQQSVRRSSSPAVSPSDQPPAAEPKPGDRAAGEVGALASTVDAIGKLAEIIQGLGIKLGRAGTRRGGSEAEVSAVPLAEPDSSGLTDGSSGSAPSESRPATIRGRVRGPGGKPVAGATVTVSEWQRSTTTGPDGRYSVRGRPGEVTLRASASGYREAGFVAMAGPGETTTRNLRLQREEWDQTSAKTAPASPSASSTVPSSPPAGSPPSSAPGTLRTGPFPPLGRETSAKPAAESAPAGPQSAKTAVPWWQESRSAASAGPTAKLQTVPQSTSIGGGTAAPRGAIARAPVPAPAPSSKPGAIAGRVTDERGHPLPGARVSVGGGPMVLTDAHGRFTIPNLAPGEYSVGVTAPGRRSESRRVKLDQGEVESLSVTLPRDDRTLR